MAKITFETPCEIGDKVEVSCAKNRITLKKKKEKE